MKRTTMKHIDTLASRVDMEFHDMFKPGSIMRNKDGYFKYGLSETIWETTTFWDYYYTGVSKDAMDNYGADIKAAMVERGYELTPLDEDHPHYDAGIASEFAQDVTQAYCDAIRQAEEGEFHRLVVRDLEAFIAEVDAPYYCLRRFIPAIGTPQSENYRAARTEEVDELYEATEIVFGFTHAWHKRYVAGLNDANASLPTSSYLHVVRYTYDPDIIERDTEEHVEGIRRIDTDYSIQEYASREVVLDLFFDCAESLSALKAAEQARQAAAEYDTNHWAWVTRRTQAMTNNTTGETQ